MDCIWATRALSRSISEKRRAVVSIDSRRSRSSVAECPRSAASSPCSRAVSACRDVIAPRSVELDTVADTAQVTAAVTDACGIPDTAAATANFVKAAALSKTVCGDLSRTGNVRSIDHYRTTRAVSSLESSRSILPIYSDSTVEARPSRV